MEKIVIPFGNKFVNLSYDEFDTDIDMNKVTKIDYSNLYGEIVTVSHLLNRVGILKAELESTVAHSKVDLDIFEANLRKIIRSNATSNGVKTTVQSVDDEVLLDPQWKSKKKLHINNEKNLQFIDSLYWSIQSKDKKLSVLMKGVTPEEFANEIVEGVVNTIMITKKDKLIKDDLK